MIYNWVFYLKQRGTFSKLGLITKKKREFFLNNNKTILSLSFGLKKLNWRNQSQYKFKNKKYIFSFIAGIGLPLAASLGAAWLGRPGHGRPDLKKSTWKLEYIQTRTWKGNELATLQSTSTAVSFSSWYHTIHIHDLMVRN